MALHTTLIFILGLIVSSLNILYIFYALLYVLQIKTCHMYTWLIKFLPKIN